MKPSSKTKATKQPAVWYSDETDWTEIAKILWDKMEQAELSTFLMEFEDAQDFSIFIRRYIPEGQILQCMHSEFGQGTIVGIAWHCMQSEYKRIKAERVEEGLEDEEDEQEY